MRSTHNKGLSKILTIGYTLAFYSAILIGTVLFLVCCPFAYAYMGLTRNNSPEKRIRYLIWVYGKSWVALLGVFTPVRRGTFSSSLPSPCIITPNHQSFFDPYLLGLWPHSEIVFFVQDWPFKIPCYGYFMKKAGYINTAKLSTGEILQQSKHFLDQGISIVIFPEGTRSTTQVLGRFHSGAFKLAVHCGVPVVPLLIQGSGVFLPKGNFWLKRTTIRIIPLLARDSRTLTAQTDRPDATLRIQVRKDLQNALSTL